MAQTPEPTAPEAARTPWTIAVSGSTGLIGTALVEALRREGHHVRRLVRSETGPRSEHIPWDPEAGTLDPRALDGVDAVVHLAGENVGERWTAAKKRRIRESRTRGTRLLADVAAQADPPPSVLVSASGISIYGDRGDEVIDEGSTLGPESRFLVRVGREWEGASQPAEGSGIRVVRLRLGMVLAPHGGALQRMLPPFRLGLGGKMGSGRQWMSWISLADAVGVFRFALATPSVAGACNAVAPNPVTNAEFTRTLGAVLGRPAVFTVPSLALRLAFGEMATETILASQRAVPKRLLEAGYRFRHPELADALQAELRR